MDGWDIALLVAAAYVAVLALVRLMNRRREQLLEQFRRQVEKEKVQREARAKKEAKRRRAA